MMLWDLLRGVKRTTEAQRLDLSALDERVRYQERRSLEQARETERIIRIMESRQWRQEADH